MITVYAKPTNHTINQQHDCQLALAIAFVADVINTVCQARGWFECFLQLKQHLNTNYAVSAWITNDVTKCWTQCTSNSITNQTYLLCFALQHIWFSCRPLAALNCVLSWYLVLTNLSQYSFSNKIKFTYKKTRVNIPNNAKYTEYIDHRLQHWSSRNLPDCSVWNLRNNFTKNVYNIAWSHCRIHFWALSTLPSGTVKQVSAVKTTGWVMLNSNSSVDDSSLNTDL